jgi:hypothetical protein
MKDNRLSVLAMNDVIDEMHRAFGLRPCLFNPGISESAVVAMEADTAAGLAMWILKSFTGSSPFYVETFNVDYRENALLLGHAGYHDASNADPGVPVHIIPDIEYENSDTFTGCATYFTYRSGPVTVVNSVWSSGRLKWMGFAGESVGTRPKMEGNCHLYCRLEPDVRRFLNEAVQSGVSQHWIVVPGKLLEELALLSEILDIDWQSVE